jgi:ParB family chromosome partitioning protein
MPKKQIEEMKNISMDQILEPSIVIRSSIDVDLVRELAESIREKGLLSPILVAARDGKFEVIAGHRRYLAHKILEAKTIKCIIKIVTDEEILILRAIENIQRADLNPMEEARVYGMLRNPGGLTIAEISKKMGKGQATIIRFLTLLKLPAPVQKALEQKQLSITVANKLAEIEDEVLRNYYLENAVLSGCSIKTAELWVSDYLATKAAQFYSPGPGMQSEMGIPEVKPFYYTCDICKGPVELSKCRHLVTCPECNEKIRR